MFLCLVKNRKLQYWLHATWRFTCLCNPSAIIFTKTCLRAVQITFCLYFTALCGCYGGDTLTDPATPHPDAACVFCTGQAYLSPCDWTAYLACGWRRHTNGSGKNTPIPFLTWAIGQLDISFRITCWESQVSWYHPFYLQRVHKMTGIISLFQIALSITLAGLFFWAIVPVLFRTYCWFIDSFSSRLWSFCLNCTKFCKNPSTCIIDVPFFVCRMLHPKLMQLLFHVMLFHEVVQWHLTSLFFCLLRKHSSDQSGALPVTDVNLST